jgi:hypothetical protein
MLDWYKEEERRFEPIAIWRELESIWERYDLEKLTRLPENLTAQPKLSASSHSKKSDKSINATLGEPMSLAEIIGIVSEMADVIYRMKSCPKWEYLQRAEKAVEIIGCSDKYFYPIADLFGDMRLLRTLPKHNAISNPINWARKLNLDKEHQFGKVFLVGANYKRFIKTAKMVGDFVTHTYYPCV